MWFRLGCAIFSPSQTWPHQHSPASLMMQTPDPQQRLSVAFIIQPLQIQLPSRQWQGYRGSDSWVPALAKSKLSLF